jgi:hypothetical protein
VPQISSNRWAAFIIHKTLMEFIYIVLGWIFINVIVKLLINSIERVYKDKIDNLVLKAPPFARLLYIELFRFIMILILLPVILLLAVPPFSRLNVLEEYRSSIRFLFSKKRFRRTAPFMFYLLGRPLSWFSNSYREIAFQHWFHKVQTTPILLAQYLETPPNKSLNLMAQAGVRTRPPKKISQSKPTRRKWKSRFG